MNPRWLVFIFLLFPALSFADSLKGRIVDPQGNRIADAKISLVDRKTGELRRTQSNADGDYEFQTLSSGEYLIEVTGTNSALTASREVRVEGDQTLQLSTTISASSTEVVVTASTTPVAIQEVSKAVDVVDAEQI